MGKVNLVGQSKREVNVNINPSRLEALGMGVDEVMAGLQSENVNIPLGRLNRNGSEYPLRISGKPDVVERFQTMVIGQRNGRPIMLSEVADIKDGIEEQRSLAFVNGIQAISLDILKQSGANTVGVVDLVKKEIDRLQTRTSSGNKDRDGARWIDHDPRLCPRCSGYTHPWRDLDNLYCLPFSQFLAVHRDYGIDASHLCHLCIHLHVLPWNDA